MILPDFKDRAGKWVKSVNYGGKLHYTRSGMLWYNMVARCKVGGKMQQREPAYIGCTHTFLDFKDFIEWAVHQVGYSLDFQLDKDLLHKGNKIYSKESCVFIPEVVNKFLNNRKNHRGDTPVGTCWNSRRGAFIAQCRFDGEYHYLGAFADAADAFATYKKFKEEKAKVLAERFKDSVDPRVYKALTNYKIEIGD